MDTVDRGYSVYAVVWEYAVEQMLDRHKCKAMKCMSID